ncbi:sporulation protein [Paenibacillus swuensis]|uniref:Sporulation protein n=1 Tax=Paenibacillus swuensis TaxID=1178515 RepID=A0A172TGH4_9BACL|nr:spore protease YyaC [Paenibacillus swuensis]ANE46036.1 sporulation protein [Paenibacillus swuensis]
MTFPFKMPNRKEPTSVKVSYTEPNVLGILTEQLKQLLSGVRPGQELVVVCVGTDRSTGDSLGPLVGTNLSRSEGKPFSVYGTLEDPVHAMNLNEILQVIQDRYNNPFVIAVDACLGQLASVGCIQLGHGPVKPGAGVNKELPPVGNIHITGIVNVGGFMEYFVLQNTRLSLVMKMADIISRTIEVTLHRAHRGYSAKPYVSLD